MKKKFCWALFLCSLLILSTVVSGQDSYALEFTPEAVKAAKYVYGAIAATVDNSQCLVIQNNSCWGVELPVAKFAGKKYTLNYEYKVDNINIPEDKKESLGFKVQIVYTVNGQDRYTHREPVSNECDWASNTLTVDFPENVSKIMLEVSMPNGKAYVRKLEFANANAAVKRSENSKNQLQTVSPALNKPVIDGIYTQQEYLKTACDHAFISSSDNRQTRRETSLFYTFDNDYLYFCALSVLPPPPQMLLKEDSLKIELISPEGTEYIYTIYADDSNNLPAGSLFRSSRSGKIDVDAQLSSTPRWICEIAIPWKALNRETSPADEQWRLQVRRNYCNPTEEALLSPEGLKVVFGKQNVFSSVRLGLRAEACRVNFFFRNDTTQKRDLQIDLMIRSLEVPMNLNRDVNLEPGASSGFEQYFMLGRSLDRNLVLSIKDKATNEVIYYREVDWNISSGLDFKDPNPPITMNFGLAPSQQRIIAKVESAAVNRFEDITEVRFKIINADNVLKQTVTAERKAPGYYYLDWRYPMLAVGEYFVVAELVHRDGHTEELRKSFWIRNFEWEHSEVGMERMVPPPFLPLQSSGSEIRALQTGYNLNGMFWDKVFALNDNILADNIKLIFNNHTFTTEFEEFTERADDLIIRKSRHAAPGLKLELTQEYEFDGVCKTTFKFIPDAGTRCDNLYIDIPLKPEIAKLLHNTGKGCRANDSIRIAAQEGVVYQYQWKNANYPSYFWLGETFKGFCHFSDEVPDPFDAVSTGISHEVIRTAQSVILRVHLAPAGKNLELKAFDYVCGFQPTPVKPRPKGFRQWSGGFWTAELPNTYMNSGISHYKQFFSDARFGHPLVCYNNDYSYVEYLLNHRHDNASDQEVRSVIAAMLAKHNLTDKKWDELFFEGDRGTLSERMFHAAKYSRNKLLHLYANPRAGYRNWPESEMYDDEWMDWGFRQPDDSYYHRIPVKSYSDMFLYYLRDFLHRFPQVKGVYYDCLYPNKSVSPFLGGRYLGPNKFSFTCDIFFMRELMKRSLKLVAQEKRFLPCDPNYPWLTIHMTDCNMAPVVGLATFSLNWEMNFGRNDYPVRFPEEFNLVQSIGTQTGTIPTVIVQTGGTIEERIRQQRSLYAVGFAFDLLNFYDPGSCEEEVSEYFNKVQTIVRSFGYGTDDVEHFPGYQAESNPVKCTPGQVKITTLKHKDGRIMLLVGNMGKACQVKLELPPGISGLANAENGQLLENNTFSLGEHDNAIFVGRWQ